VTRHTSPEKIKEDGWVPRKGVPVVEQHKTETPTQHHPDNGDHGNKVGHLVFLQFADLQLHEPTDQKIGNQKARHVGEAIPSDAEAIREMDRNRIKVMNPGRQWIGHRHISDLTNSPELRNQAPIVSC